MQTTHNRFLLQTTHCYFLQDDSQSSALQSSGKDSIWHKAIVGEFPFYVASALFPALFSSHHLHMGLNTTAADQHDSKSYDCGCPKDLQTPKKRVLIFKTKHELL